MKYIPRINSIGLSDLQIAVSFSKHLISTYWQFNFVSLSDEPADYVLKFPYHPDFFDINVVFDTLLQYSFNHVVGCQIQRPDILTGFYTEGEQISWLSAFGRSKCGVLALHNLDKDCYYESIFGSNINKRRIIYADAIPRGNVLLFDWSSGGTSYMHFSIEKSADSQDEVQVDVWLRNQPPESPSLSTPLLFDAKNQLHYSVIDDIMEMQ